MLWPLVLGQPLGRVRSVSRRGGGVAGGQGEDEGRGGAREEPSEDSTLGRISTAGTTQGKF